MELANEITDIIARPSLARKHPDSRILLTTLSDSLSNALATKLRRLIANEPRLGERSDVYALDALGSRLYNLALAARCASPLVPTSEKF